MLPPLYLLLLIWPNCPLVPPLRRVRIEPTPLIANYRVGEAVGGAVGGTIGHCDWRIRPRFSEPSYFAFVAAAEAERSERTLRRVCLPDRGIVIDEGSPVTPQVARWLATPMPSTEPTIPPSVVKPTRRARPFVHPAKPIQNHRTPSRHQKPWRRPRGLSSAARRRQNKNRKGRR